MEAFFSEILNMSLTASVVTAVVLLARMGLKKAPKIYSYALWAVVLFRLLCPVSIQSPVSVLEVTKPEITQSEGLTTSISYIPAQRVQIQPQVQSEDSVQPSAPQETEKESSLSASAVVSVLWLFGTAVMLLRSVVEYLQLRKNLIGAIHFRGNVYLADHITTPFVMGVLNPRIYLPSGIPAQERRYIVEHEHHHIRRGDHIVKLLAYFALSLHWFNPLAWVAFVQAGKDMEMSCDEAVIKRLGSEIRADYSASLLRLATRQRIFSGMPLAFGEGDTKGRIRNMAKWKKPKVWVSVPCVLLCVAILMACGMNPESNSGTQVTLNSFHVTIPDGYSVENTEEGVDFRNGEETLGGIVERVNPFPLKFGGDYAQETWNSFEWLEALGIREVHDWTIGMSNSDDIIGSRNRDDVLVVDCHPTNAEDFGRYHFLWFGEGDAVYDLWFEKTMIEDIEIERIVDTVFVKVSEKSAEPDAATLSAEEAALEKVKAVFDTVRSGSYLIQAEQKNAGNEGPSGYLTTYFSDGENWLQIHEVLVEGTNQTEAGDYYNRMAHLSHKGFYYSNDGHWNERGAIQWDAITREQMEEVKAGRTSRLATMNWEEVNVTNLLVTGDDKGWWLSCLVEEPDGSEYTAKFRFDYQDNFYEAVFDFQDGQKDAYTVTESVVTLNPEEVAEQIESYYRYGIPVPQAEGKPVDMDFMTGEEQLQFGAMTMTLPEEYSCREENRIVILSHNGADVGSITCWAVPEVSLTQTDTKEWFRAMGLPEAQESEEPIAFMGGGTLYDGYDAEFFNELHPEKLNVKHKFFLVEDLVYDVCWDMNQISGIQAEKVMKTIALSGEMVEPPAPSESAQLAKCKAVLDMVQDCCGISTTQDNRGSGALNDYSMTTFYQKGENWLLEVEIPESGGSGFFYYMEVDGIHYNTERTGWDENGPIWTQQSPVEAGKPWLATFRWDEEKVTYMGTTVNGGEESIMLRIDEPYPYGEDNGECYFVSFSFADGSAFLKAFLQVNPFMSNSFNKTERILTLDANEVGDQIEKEYARAAGSVS